MSKIGDQYRNQKNLIDSAIRLLIADYQNLNWETLPKSELLKRLGMINDKQESIETDILSFRKTVLTR
jgi:hypothetical protein